MACHIAKSQRKLNKMSCMLYIRPSGVWVCVEPPVVVALGRRLGQRGPPE